MSFLYVYLFSNGHLKVGRSVNALARISQHEELREPATVARMEHARG